MDWIQPLYTRGEVDRAGKKLAVTGWVGNGRGEPDTRHELAILNNWRAAQSFPLNTIQMGLRRRARNIEPEAIVSQRLKRAPATIDRRSKMKHELIREVDYIQWPKPSGYRRKRFQEVGT
ncbi:hypothetical protein [Candidatus Palauibacter sp.]|uniref:hypothetical protein n=1 Tax=Candidatus Palauibacter sp. TaxID=3101350 RepID=UPI003AF31248